MNIRLATWVDQDAVFQLLNQLGEVINENVNSDPKNTQSHVYGRDAFVKALKADHIKIIIIETDEKIVGLASFYIFCDLISGSKFAHIDDFIIDKNHRNRGVGSYFMKKLLMYAQENQIETVKLTSSIQLTKAHAFYEKCGGVYAQKVIKFDTSAL